MIGKAKKKNITKPHSYATHKTIAKISFYFDGPSFSLSEKPSLPIRAQLHTSCFAVES